MAGTPLHPATVHFPITFIALTGFLDILYAAKNSSLMGNFINSTALTYGHHIGGLMELIHWLSYYTTILALLTSIPAIITGALELVPLIMRDGMNTPKVRTGLTHASLNDVATVALAYNWWTRRSREEFVPYSTNVVLSGLLAVPIMFYAASLGGRLVYEYGMGVGKASSKQKKSQ